MMFAASSTANDSELLRALQRGINVFRRVFQTSRKPAGFALPQPRPRII
jgi:hypothetical protein